MFNFFKNKKRKTFLLLFFGFFLFSFFKKIKKDEDLEDRIDDVRHNFIDFLHKEKKQIKDLESGKEDIKDFSKNSKNIFWDYFVPGNHNNHKPKILHTRSLLIIALTVFFLKVFLIFFIFFAPQNKAMMSSDFNAIFLNLINKDRVVDGLKPLKENTDLDFFARLKGEDMLNNNYFAHYSPSGKKPWDWIDTSKYNYLYAGENLAMDFDDPFSVHQALMASPSHRENILSEKFDDIGLAVVSGKMNGKETNILVEFFAKKKAEQNVSEKNLPKDSVLKKPQLNFFANSANDNAGTSVLALQSADKTIKPVLKSVKTISGKQENKIKNAKPIIYKKLNIKKLYYLNLERAVNITIFSLMILMIIALIFNILFKMEVQHKPVIAQTLILIFFIYALYLFKLNFFKNSFDLLLVL